MDWTQSLTIILSNVGVLLVLFVYLMNRMDSNQKQMNEKIDSNHKQMNEKIDKNFDVLSGKITSLDNRMTKMEAETKIELRNINQRLTTIEGYLVPKKLYHFETPPEEPKEN